MAYKAVIRLDMQCSKCKKVALHSVTNIEGIDSLTINMQERTLTVIGDADPVCMVQMLRKKFRCAQLVSSGPNPPPPPPPPLKLKCVKCGKEIDAPKHCQACSPPPPKPKLKCEKCGQEYDELKCCPACPPPPPPSPPPPPPPPPPPKICCCCYPPCPPGSGRLGKCCRPAGLPCSCGLVNCPPPSYGCSSKSEILWPQHHNPFAPEEVYYVWKEDEHETCSIM